MTKFSKLTVFVFSVLFIGVSNASATETCGTVKSIKYYGTEWGDQLEVNFIDGTSLKNVNQPNEQTLVAAIAGGLKVCFTGTRSGGLSVSLVSK